MSKTYNDPIKQLDRIKQREFIRENLLPFKKPKDIKVICLPGAEAEGEEALEVKEIYDVLGIPRSNILGIEQDAKRAERLRKANLGIEVLCSTDLEFFKKTDRRFGIINLDYKGQKTWKERDAQRYITGKGLLDNLGIFISNHYVKRESNSMKAALMDRSYDGLDKAIFARTSEEAQKYLDESTLELEKTISRIGKKELNLDIARDFGITVDTIRVFGGGIAEIAPHKSPFFLVNKFEYKEEARSGLIEELSIKMHTLIGGCKGIEAEVKDWHKNKALLFAVFKNITLELEKTISEAEAIALVTIAMRHYHGSYCPEKISRCTYISNKNANILTDMFLFRKSPYNISNYLDEVIRFNAHLKTFDFNPNRLSKDRLLKKMEKVFEIAPVGILFYPADLPKPEYLGSSYIPPKTKERINRKEAEELLSSGYSSKEIYENYSGFSKMQLAAFKAYQTMRKFVKSSA